jgi:hypothetical protein
VTSGFDPAFAGGLVSTPLDHDAANASDDCTVNANSTPHASGTTPRRACVFLVLVEVPLDRPPTPLADVTRANRPRRVFKVRNIVLLPARFNWPTTTRWPRYHARF